MQNVVRSHAIECEIELPQKIKKKTEQQRPLLRYMYQNCIIVISNDMYFAYKFLSNFILQKPRSAYPKNFGKSEQQRPLLRYIYPNRTIFISVNIYVYTFLCNSIHQKPRSTYSKNSGKSVATAKPVERFSPKVDRNQFMFG